MLSGLRILDCSDESAGLAGRILAELGADVVRIEPPGGDLAARCAPYAGGVPDPERSLPWQVFQAGKRGITLDGAAPAAGPVLARLLARADALLESFAPATRAAWGLGFADVAAAHPRLVHCSVTPFGTSGPYAGFRAGDLVVAALGGGLVRDDARERPPVRCAPPAASLHAGAEAALAVVMGLHAREAHGRGQHIDVSAQECQVHALRGGPGVLARGGRGPGRPEIWAARDGWVRFGPLDAPERATGLRALRAWMAEEGTPPPAPGSGDGLDAAVAAFFAARGRDALFAGAQQRGVALAPCLDPSEVLALAALRARSAFPVLALPDGRRLALPGCLAHVGGAAIGPRRPAPRVGEHNEEVYGEAGIAAASLGKLAAEGLV